jgi:hypothetical protein
MDLDETAHRLTEFRMRRRWTALCQKGTDPFAALNSEASLSFGSDKTPDNQTWTTGYDTTEATRILTNHMTQLGVEVNFDGNWLRDPLTGVTSLPQPSFTMKLSDRLAVGDIRQVWELSRMQHLPVLAAAYTATQDEVYANRCAIPSCAVRTGHRVSNLDFA